MEAHLSTAEGEGIRDRLEALMDRYQTPVYEFLVILLGNRDSAQEVTQETFVRAFENLQRGKPVTAPWLYKVARNRAMDEFRHRRRERSDARCLEGVAFAGRAEDSLAIAEAFRRLSPDDRTVLYLSAVQGLDVTEIAAALGIRATAVRMRLSRARERFRRAYGGSR